MLLLLLYVLTFWKAAVVAAVTAALPMAQENSAALWAFRRVAALAKCDAARVASAGSSAAKEQKAPRRGKKRRREKEVVSEVTEKPQAAEAGEADGKSKEKKSSREKKAKASQATRFQRELKAYEEAQAAKAAAIHQREEEKRERNRKKKQTAKERALTGKLLAKRNVKGQPSMRNLLEMVTSKLEADSAAFASQNARNSQAPHKARGFGRRPRGS
eukprot:s4098_g4.t1